MDILDAWDFRTLWKLLEVWGGVTPECKIEIVVWLAELSYAKLRFLGHVDHVGEIDSIRVTFACAHKRRTERQAIRVNGSSKCCISYCGAH